MSPLVRPNLSADALFLGLGLLLAACSIGTAAHTPCSSNDQCAVFEDAIECGEVGYCVVPPSGACETTADCHDSVGFGSQCLENRCEDVVAIERCAERTFPKDLFEDLAQHRDRLVFGVLMDETTAAHVQRENSAELAVSQINEQRGIDGRELGLVFCDVQGGASAPYSDDLSRPSAAVAAAEWLVNVLELPGLIGPSSSGDTTRVYTEVVQATAGRSMVMTPSGTSPSLTDLDPPDATDESPGLLWRSAPSASQQGVVIADHMAARTDVEITDVAILHEEAAFGEGVARTFGESWTQDHGGTFRLFGYKPGDMPDLVAQIAVVGDALADSQALLVLTQVNESTVFMNEATDDANYSDDIPIYFGDTGANAEIFEGASSPRLFDNVMAATAEPAHTFVYDSYRDAFIDRFDVDPADSSFTANTYDAVWLMALGAAWATFQGEGELDGDGRHPVDGVNIARGLRKTTGGSAVISFIKTEWPGGLSQFMAGRAIDVTGASGQHDWDLSTEEASGPTALYQADSEGNMRIVFQTE